MQKDDPTTWKPGTILDAFFDANTIFGVSRNDFD